MQASQKLRLAVNTTCLHPHAAGGWARYTESLLEALEKFSQRERQFGGISEAVA